MKYKAKENFCGVVSMCVGEVQDIPDDIAEGLTMAGYIEPVEAKATKETKEPTKKKGAKA